MQGPFTAAEVDAKLGVNAWRCLLRFGVEQGIAAATRALLAPAPRSAEA